MNNCFLSRAFGAAFFFCLSPFTLLAQKPVDRSEGTSIRIHKEWAIQMLNAIQLKAANGVPIKVAVVDDAFRVTHKSLKDYIYTNTQEVPGNFQDDDLNGYLDDFAGFDVSDKDHDVSIPLGREEQFYHGTYIAGVITSLFEYCYGSEAPKLLKIIPVKVLADKAESTYLADGYKGIRYACDMGADIVCCAWSGGQITDDDKAVISKALARGTIFVGAAGNFYSEIAENPSALPGFISVAAIDSTFKKSPRSNYGMRVNLAAPGVSVYGSYPTADNAFVVEEGTSPASALVTACLAVLKVAHPTASPQQLLKAIQNTAVNIDIHNPTYGGKLGAGLPDLARAHQFLSDENFKYQHPNQNLAEGNLFFKNKLSENSWTISPHGAYKGLHLFAASANYKGHIQIFSRDSLIYSGAMASLARGNYFPGNSFKLVINQKPRPSKTVEFSYYMQTIDSTTLYCRDVVELKQPSGVISDNSGSDNYANNSSCKWLISAPEGKRICLTFDEIDTQPNVDFLWIFDGHETHQENLIAKFSGNNTPPAITSLSNTLLIWFLSDSTITGKGWKASYILVDQ